jgi:TolB protein
MRGYRFARSLRVTPLIVFSIVIVALGAGPSSATYPGSNGRILVSERVDHRYQVFSMDADGTHQTQLTHMKRSVYVATATADGTRIAFDSGGDIWVIRVDGSHLRRLTDTGTDYGPVWSPDGTQIAFTRATANTFTIALMNSDGTGQRIIVNRHRYYSYTPDWSPDGTTIVFTTFVDGGNSVIDSINVVTGEKKGIPIEFSPNTIENAFLASWSPDGSRLAFTGQPVHHGRPVCKPRGNLRECQDLYIVSATGGIPTRLTDDLAEDLAPVWSPDGKRVMFSRDDRSGGCTLYRFLRPRCVFDVYTMKADGSDRQRVTHAKADAQGDWWIAG